MCVCVEINIPQCIYGGQNKLLESVLPSTLFETSDKLALLFHSVIQANWPGGFWEFFFLHFPSQVGTLGLQIYISVPDFSLSLRLLKVFTIA